MVLLNNWPYFALGPTKMGTHKYIENFTYKVLLVVSNFPDGHVGLYRCYHEYPVIASFTDRTYCPGGSERSLEQN
jgi:hypothetical protein